MEDFIFTPIVLAVGLAIHAVVLRFHDREEGRVLTLSFAFHVAASIGLILIYTLYYTEGGDMISYHRFSVPIAGALRYDFESIAPEVLNLLFQREQHLPYEIVGESSTGSMQATAVVLSFLLGDSIYASALLITVGSYVSKVLVYRAFRTAVPERSRRLLLLALMLSPSGVMWTSGLLKEPMVMVFIGPLVLSLRWLLEGRRLALATVMAVGAGGAISLFKPYVLIALVMASGVWIAWARVIRDRGAIVLKPGYLGVSALVVFVSFAGATKFFPKLTLDSVGESMAYQRRVAGEIEGGSNFSIEGPGIERDSTQNLSLASQLGLAPLALITSLFRPFLFEARKAMQLLNSLEMTWLLVLFFQAFWGSGFRRGVAFVTQQPVLMFCFAFVLVLALGTGLSTSNLGALSRYRAPMMPFFLFLLLAVRAEQRFTNTGPSSRPMPLSTSLRPAQQA
ncbi:MAG: hypothetical protein Q8N26_36805 [Myxococcales bacterium]|nr:hypothetical protein [Myxococcales bacterium]